MHRNAKKIIAAFMFHGGSGGRRPESFCKKMNQGNLIPACRNTPAEAAASMKYTNTRLSSAAACEIMVLVVKPEVSGNPEMASAPTPPKISVQGIVL